MNRALIVEDNPDNMKLIEWVLEDAGFSFDSFFNAEDALANLTSGTYTIILLDISLPGMDGKEAAKIIRGYDGFEQTPMYAVTAHAFVNESKEIMEAGFNGIITKPIDEDAFLAMLQEYLDD